MKKKTKPQLKETHCKVHTWKADVLLVIGDHELILPWARDYMFLDRFKEVEELIKNDGDIGTKTQGTAYFLEGGGCLIWLKKYDAGVLVHEIMHAVFHILSTKQVKLNYDTQEVYAYLFEHIFNTLKK